MAFSIFIILFIENILIKYNITCNNYFIKYKDPDFINIRYNISN
jgi:hypothetical protein